jgi:dienelactone hydrolase
MIRSIIIVVFASIIIIPSIQAADNAEHQEALAKHYRLEKPDGTGPFPAVIMVSGCKGFDAKWAKGHYDYTQSKLVESGFVTLRVNYLAARSVSICWPLVTIEEVASDISIAVKYLRQQPFVKKGALNVLGWSHGGGAALKALGQSGNREPVQVDAVVVYYPSCNFWQEWDSKTPILVLVGAIDNLTPISECESVFNILPKRDNVTVRVYDNARHCFDFPDLPAKMQSEFGGTIGYNEAAAKAAWVEMTNFLKR